MNVKKFSAYAGMSLWNTFFCRIPSYWTRRFILRHLYQMTLSNNTNIHSRVTLFNPWRIVAGNGSNVQMMSFLDGRGGITIGSNTDITIGVKIFSEDHNPQSSGYETRPRPVMIGNDVFIGSFAIILPGISVGDGAVIGAGSVVTKNVEEYSIVAGNPARRIGMRTRSLDYRCSYRRPFH